jgi:hypothetical protein
LSPEGAGENLVAFPSRFERDLEDRRVRGQKEPGRAIQSNASLVRRGRLADDIQREPMKLPPGKAGPPGHYAYSLSAVGRV